MKCSLCFILFSFVSLARRSLSAEGFAVPTVAYDKPSTSLGQTSMYSPRSFAGKLKQFFNVHGGSERTKQRNHVGGNLSSSQAHTTIELNIIVPPPSKLKLLEKVTSFVGKNVFMTGAAVSIVLAALYPDICKTGGLLKPELTVNKMAVSMIFLLSGLSLSVRDMWSAMTNYKLNSMIQIVMFGVTPLYYEGIAKIMRYAKINSHLIDGIICLGCLPTTVNMCIALTTAAGGNVASAICNAVLGNLLGIFVTPALLYHHFGHTVSLPFFFFSSEDCHEGSRPSCDWTVSAGFFYGKILPAAQNGVLKSNRIFTHFYCIRHIL